MGFSGYHQVICANGHYYEADAGPFRDEEACHECDAPFETALWSNLVDTTNCDDYGLVSLDLLDAKYLVKPERIVDVSSRFPEEPRLRGFRLVAEPALYTAPDQAWTDWAIRETKRLELLSRMTGSVAKPVDASDLKSEAQ